MRSVMMGWHGSAFLVFRLPRSRGGLHHRTAAWHCTSAALPGNVASIRAPRRGGHHAQHNPLMVGFRFQSQAAMHHDSPRGSSPPAALPATTTPSKLAFLPGSSLSFPHGLSPTQGYEHLVAAGKIEADPQQVAVLRELSDLYNKLAAAAAPPAHTAAKAAPNANGLWDSLFGRAAPKNPAGTMQHGAARSPSGVGAASGVYLWGGTGCGKTFLMDIFYTALQTPAKRRVHFHAFMLDVHARLHAIRSGGHRGDPIPVLAAEMMRGVLIMCFDEMQVTDVGDAMIMRRLFDELFARKLIVVATSNRPPVDLYATGLQRELFMPFIHAVEERCRVVHLHSPIDYRLVLAGRKEVAQRSVGPSGGGAPAASGSALAEFSAGTVWFCPPARLSHQQQQQQRVATGSGGEAVVDLEHPATAPAAARAATVAVPAGGSISSRSGEGNSPVEPIVAAAFEESWQRLAATAGLSPRSVVLEAQGRRVEARRSLGLDPQQQQQYGVPRNVSAARFTFAELCEAPLYAGDYSAIAAAFSHVFIEDIPVLTLSERNELRRFITLIDVLYEAKVQLVSSAAEQPWAMLRAEFREEGARGGGDARAGHPTSSGGAVLAGARRISHAPDERMRAKYDEVFAFDRTVSRLMEMGSEEYRVKSKWGVQH